MIKKQFTRKNKSNIKNTLKHKKTSYKKSHAKKQNKKSRKLNSKNSRKSRKSRRSMKKGGEEVQENTNQAATNLQTDASGEIFENVVDASGEIFENVVDASGETTTAVETTDASGEIFENVVDDNIVASDSEGNRNGKGKKPSKSKSRLGRLANGVKSASSFINRSNNKSKSQLPHNKLPKSTPNSTQKMCVEVIKTGNQHIVTKIPSQTK